MARRAVSETDNEGPIPSPEAYTTRGNWVFLDFPAIL
jgi:hypothetical protein